jgi:AraC-like DNA-binding protein
MDNTILHNISLAQFKSFFSNAPCIGIGDDFYMLDVAFTHAHRPLHHPCRFDGFMLLYCVKGKIRMNVNLKEYEVSEGMLFMNLPGNIIRVNEIVDGSQEDIRYFCMAISREFSQGLSLDVTKLFNEGVSMLENPNVLLSSMERELTKKHVGLLREMLGSDMPYKKEAVQATLTSLFYALMGIWNSAVAQENAESQSTRSKVIFDKFMKLVSEYHTQYRNVGFYADKLCLTPKYLSKLIKNATGRSAPEWIDSYVILEAKNLLKYSGTTIKEIVYKLNFPNQSVFYKFFKARTGMTPSEYRKS